MERKRRLEGLKGAALSLWDPLSRWASRAYVAGPETVHAVRACRALEGAGIGSVICYWNDESDSPRAVADRSLVALASAAPALDDFYLSLKAPALGYSAALVDEITARAAALGVRVLFDAQRADTVGATLALAERASRGPCRVGVALPGRFVRSVKDAAFARERGLGVRVVKGQVPDPAAPRRDARRGFLEVVDALAGSALTVAVASHDVPLVREALSRLKAAGTPCELEMLFGLPFEPALAVARALSVPARVYVPFGSPRLPYHLSELRRNPRVLSWIVRDLGRKPAREIARLARA